MSTAQLVAVVASLAVDLLLPAGQAQQAEHAYTQGRFGPARAAYEAALEAAPDDHHATERLGFIHFFSGEYPEAIPLFRKVAEACPSRRRLMLAYVAFAQYLMRDYAGVVLTLEGLGHLSVLNIDQVRLLAEETPYQIKTNSDLAVLPFLQLDPLPVVEISVNSHKASVLIDTGAAQLVLDPEFADAAGIHPVSEQDVKGFAGGKVAPVSYGMARSVSLGDIALRRVPVWVLATRRLSPDFGRTIDGVLGTEVLMQFLPTLDFRDMRLVLRLRTDEHRAEVLGRHATARIPFIIDGIHCMYAPCFINGRGPVLMYFDSGMADDRGASLGLSGAGLDSLHLPRPTMSAQGVSGGGTHQFGYVDIDSIRVANLVRYRQIATYAGLEGSLFAAPGYKTYGMLSHNFLKHYRWTIDFDDRVFLLDE